VSKAEVVQVGDSAISGATFGSASNRGAGNITGQAGRDLTIAGRDLKVKQYHIGSIRFGTGGLVVGALLLLSLIGGGTAAVFSVASGSGPPARTSQDPRYAAIWEQASGPLWRSVQGLSSAEYQRTLDDLSGQGFRPVQVSGYSVSGEDHYAAIFEKRAGPPLEEVHGLNAADYQQAFNRLSGQGFREVQVSGYSVRGEDHYAAIFEKSDGPAWVAFHGLNAADYQQAFNKLSGQGFREVLVSGYSAE
jgi:Bacterial tandem repeat domain 1